MNVDTHAINSAIGRDRLETIAKVVLAIAGLLFLAYLAQFLPGTGHLIPASDMDGGVLVGALVTLVVVALLVYLASALARLVSMVLTGPPVLIESISSVVRWLTLLVAILLGHSGLSPLAETILGGARWTFDVAVMLIAIPVLLAIAIRLYIALDPTARYLTDSVIRRVD